MTESSSTGSLRRIVVIGPESTGKSTLCEELAQHYDASWCPEFAREYLLTYGTDYAFEDLLTIAKGQLALEDEYAILAQQEWEAQEYKKTTFPIIFSLHDLLQNEGMAFAKYIFTPDLHHIHIGIHK